MTLKEYIEKVVEQCIKDMPMFKEGDSIEVTLTKWKDLYVHYCSKQYSEFDLIHTPLEEFIEDEHGQACATGFEYCFCPRTFTVTECMYFHPAYYDKEIENQFVELMEKVADKVLGFPCIRIEDPDPWLLTDFGYAPIDNGYCYKILEFGKQLMEFMKILGFETPRTKSL